MKTVNIRISLDHRLYKHDTWRVQKVFCICIPFSLQSAAEEDPGGEILLSGQGVQGLTVSSNLGL